MTRKEILEYLNYKGRYTKDVKKRLNKLLKKYHPDNNKNDKDTILVLYQIKKELEDGTLKYDNSSKKDEKVDYSFFIELMIKRLKSKKTRIDKKLDELYNKINYHYEKVNNKQDELSFIDMDILEIEEEISRVLKMDIIDFIIAFSIIIFIVVMIINKNLLFLLIIIFLIFIELYYMYIRKNIYLDKMEKLKKIKKIRKNVNADYKIIKDKIVVLEKDEVDLKRERTRINNDIFYYSHELSNIKDKELSKDFVNENEMGYVKKK